MAILITDVELVSTDSTGGQGNGDSRAPILPSEGIFSPDGTNIIFYGAASNLVSGDTNGTWDVFIKDLTTGVTTRVSTNSLGGQGNNVSSTPIFSTDGTKIAFASSASNLVAGDANGEIDVFVKDLITGETTKISTDSLGGQGNDASFHAVFSPDGTKIAFYSSASNLVSGDTNGQGEIFIKDLVTGETTRIATDALGVEGNNDSIHAVFSPDGTKIAFQSNASNLVSSDTNGSGDIFVKNLVTGVVTSVSTDSSGRQANEFSDGAVFSPDGSKILFYSAASNLVAGDTNSEVDVFIKDLTTGAVTLVSADAFGVQGNSASFQAVFSPDGSKALFYSAASNLVAGDTNGFGDLFIKDLTTGTVALISTNTLGEQGNSSSSKAWFSPDGTQIAFESRASNLVAGDTNEKLDIFLVTTNLPAGIYGTGLADVLNGTDADDIIYGFQGNDTINGLSGNDTLKGGDGDDRIEGHAAEGVTADDTDSEPPAYVAPNNTSAIFGENGNDTLINGLFMDGGEGNDTITNSLTQISEIHGGSGDDYVMAAGVIYGNDYLSDREYKWLSANLMDSQNYTVIRGGSFYGGDGNDTIINSHGFSDGGDGDDAITANGEILGGNGNDVIAVMGGLTDITSSENLDSAETRTGQVNGGSGNDVIYGASGSDAIYGGDGNDTITDFFEAISLRDADNTVGAFISGDAGNDHISLGYTQERDFSISGGSDDDIIILQSVSSSGGFAHGDDGNDWIEAHIDYSRDRLRPSVISLDGGRGNDTLIVHTRADVNGGEDDDLIRLQFFYDVEAPETTNAFTGETIAFGASETTVGSWIDGGAGYDVVEIVDFRVFTVANFADGFELTNIERLVGNALDNIINLTLLPVGDINVQGLGGHDIIWSNIGNDTLEGGDGNDTIRGAAGNDVIFGGNDQDVLKGGDGSDTIYGDDGNDELYGESGSDKLYGGVGNDKLSGGDDIDHLNGGDGADKLYGGIGNDLLKGDAGNDSLSGDDGNDKLWGNFGDDTLNGGNGTDELYGDDENDKLYGGAGVDKLSGGNGNDRLTGGEGGDNLWGGAGSDRFVFDAASLSARDIVKDFSTVQGDKLELSNILTGYDPLTSAIADFVKVTESSGKSYLSVDANGATGGSFFIQIAQIDGATGMTNVELLLNDHVLIVTNGAVV